MSREKEFAKNTVVLIVGKIFSQLITFFLLPLYTFYLTTEEFGVVELLNVLVFLLLPIITLQIEQAVFRKIIESRNNEKNIQRIITSSIIFLVIGIIVVLMITNILSLFVNNEYIFFLMLNIIAYIWATYFQQIARGFGENVKYSISGVLSSFFTIAINIILLVIFKFSVKGVLIGTFVGQSIIVVYLFFALKIYKYINKNYIDFKIIKEMLSYSVPLIPNSISSWIINASDRILVSLMLGVGESGILSAAHKFPSVYITLFNFVYLSWTETVVLHFKDIDFIDYFNKVMNKILRLFITLGIGILGIMPFVYKILINDCYFIGIYQIPIMMLASIFTVYMGLITTIYIARKETKVIAKSISIACCINIIINCIFIRYMRFICSFFININCLYCYFYV